MQHDAERCGTFLVTPRMYAHTRTHTRIFKGAQNVRNVPHVPHVPQGYGREWIIVDIDKQQTIALAVGRARNTHGPSRAASTLQKSCCEVHDMWTHDSSEPAETYSELMNNNASGIAASGCVSGNQVDGSLLLPAMHSKGPRSSVRKRLQWNSIMSICLYYSILSLSYVEFIQSV